MSSRGPAVAVVLQRHRAVGAARRELGPQLERAARRPASARSAARAWSSAWPGDRVGEADRVASALIVDLSGQHFHLGGSRTLRWSP